MKLRSLIIESKNSKIRLLITESQFRTLAQNVLSIQEQKQIRNTYLNKTNSNEKKK